MCVLTQPSIWSKKMVSGGCIFLAPQGMALTFTSCSLAYALATMEALQALRFWSSTMTFYVRKRRIEMKALNTTAQPVASMDAASSSCPIAFAKEPISHHKCSPALAQCCPMLRPIPCPSLLNRAYCCAHCRAHCCKEVCPLLQRSLQNVSCPSLPIAVPKFAPCLL